MAGGPRDPPAATAAAAPPTTALPSCYRAKKTQARWAFLTQWGNPGASGALEASWGSPWPLGWQQGRHVCSDAEIEPAAEGTEGEEERRQRKIETFSDLLAQQDSLSGLFDNYNNE